MNTKLTCLSAALALLIAAPVYADQSSGRSSVYASPGAANTPPKIDPAKIDKAQAAGNGRNSVYAHDLPTPSPRERITVVASKPGRA